MRTLQHIVVVLVVLWAVPMDLHAKDTALIIGLSYEKAPGFKESLPGIDLDMQAMDRVAKALGFQDVRVLWNQQASYAGLRKAFQDLASQTTGNDRVLIYYTGHGTQVDDSNGDETDGQDEALVPFDAQQGYLLIDDQFRQWLEAINSNRILVIVDACHSGTGTRAVNLTGSSMSKPKFIKLGPDSGRKPTASSNAQFLDDFLPKGNARGKFVSLMASKDSETAGATSRGSYFTLALSLSFDSFVKAKTCTFELEKFFRQAQALVIEATEDNDSPQTPQLDAEDPVLSKQTLQLMGVTGCAPSPQQYTERMQYWRDFATQASEQLTLSAAGTSIRVHASPDSSDRCMSQQGLLSLEVTAPRDGYLTVLNIGDGDAVATVLFPNRFVQDNYVRRGQKIQIPPPKGSWCLPARLPQGRDSQNVIVIGAFTDHKVDLFNNGSGTGAFREAPNGSRSFAAEGGKAVPEKYAASQILIRITR